MPMTAQAAHKEMIWDGDTLIYRLQVSPDGWFYVNDQPTGKATDANGGWPTAPEHFGMQMADLVPGWGRVPVGPADAEFVQMPAGGIRLNFRIPTTPRRRLPVGDRGGAVPGLRPGRPRAAAAGPAPRPVTKRRNPGRSPAGPEHPGAERACLLTEGRHTYPRSRKSSGPTARAGGPSYFQAGQIPSWRGSCERYALSPVADACRWSLLLLSPLLSAQPKSSGGKPTRTAGRSRSERKNDPGRGRQHPRAADLWRDGHENSNRRLAIVPASSV
jgi:hypothetical protein